MEFGEHWLQRLSLVLARGQGDLVLEAVKTARKNHRLFMHGKYHFCIVNSHTASHL